MKITFDGGGDHAFRSELERVTAAELTRLGVTFTYEAPVILAGGRSVPYLPDFTIAEAPAHLALPQWVECKPQQMLYELRDVTGVTRRAGEYFKADVTVEGMTAADLMDRTLNELAKPKRLAELTGLSVLVVGGVNGTNRLSALLTEDGVTFSRAQPFVNQRGVQRAAESEARRQENAERYDRVMADHNAKRAAEVVDATQRRKAEVRYVVVTFTGITPRYASPCHGCLVPAGDGTVYRVTDTSGATRWLRVCDACQQEAKQ